MDSGFLWLHDVGMAKTVERIDLPDTAEEIKARAAEAGLAVEEYVHRALEASDQILTNAQFIAMVTALPKVEMESSAADIRELRGPLPEPADDRR